MPEITGSEEKLKVLCSSLRQLDKAAVCFSGGMDSSFLLWACTLSLPLDNITAFTFDAATYSAAEKARASATARYLKVRHAFLESPEMENSRFVQNDL
jgi:uncharacterized protein